jgi:hypothetical protein
MLRDDKMAASFFGRHGSFGEILPLCRALPTAPRHKHTLKYHAAPHITGRKFHCSASTATGL